MSIITMLYYLFQQLQALAGPYYDFALAAVIILLSLVAAKIVRALFERLKKISLPSGENTTIVLSYAM